MTQAVILAGGKGTRLSAVTGEFPKVLVPIDGVPIVERQILLLSRYGVREVFLTTGYLAETVAQRLGDGSRFGVRLHCVREDVPLGTAGGVAALRERLTEDFFVFYGDVLVHMDLGRLLDFHRTRNAAATVVVHPNDHPYDSDLVAYDDADGRMTGFHAKPRPPGGPDLANRVSAALYVLHPSALSFIAPGEKQDFVRDVFPRMLEQHARIYAYNTTEYLKDMGTPDRLQRVERDFQSGLVESMHWDRPRAAAFLDRDGVINEEIGGVHDPERLAILPGVPEAIRRLNRAGILVAVVTNQPDIAKGLFDEARLHAVHRRLETALGEAHAWLDGIRFCPHHPERGFAGERAELKIACDCRKPRPGLLQQHAATLPIDLPRSVMIGDSWRDAACAHALSLDAVGVRTGDGLRQAPPAEHALAGRPDAIVAGLPEAVSLLLDPDPGADALADRIADALAGGATRPLRVWVGGPGVGTSPAVFRAVRRLRERGITVGRVPWAQRQALDRAPADVAILEHPDALRDADAPRGALRVRLQATAETPTADPGDAELCVPAALPTLDDGATR